MDVPGTVVWNTDTNIGEIYAFASRARKSRVVLTNMFQIHPYVYTKQLLVTASLENGGNCRMLAC